VSDDERGRPHRRRPRLVDEDVTKDQQEAIVEEMATAIWEKRRMNWQSE